MPNEPGSAATSSTATPSTVTPTARRSCAPDDRHDLRHGGEALEHGPRPSRRDDDGELARRVDPAPDVAGHDAADAGRDLLHERTRPGEVQRAPARLAAILERQRFAQALLRLRADPGHLEQPSRCGGGTQRVDVVDSQRPPDLAPPSVG